MRVAVTHVLAFTLIADAVARKVADNSAQEWNDEYDQRLRVYPHPYRRNNKQYIMIDMVASVGFGWWRLCGFRFCRFCQFSGFDGSVAGFSGLGG